jgi:Trypsin
MPEYRKLIEESEQSDNDIALIMLDEPVRNLPLVPIATQVANLVGQAATIYGFGISQTYDASQGQPPPSPFMRKGELTILDKDTCAKKWKPEITDNKYVCAIGNQPACRVSPLIAI